MFLLICFSACDSSSHSKKKTLLAKVGETELFLEDISKNKLTPIMNEDSASRVRRYVENWTEEQFFLQQAKELVQEDAAYLNELIEEYKRNLLIYELEKQWIETFSDTLVSEEDIQLYYDNNKDNFQLRKNIVKIRYIKISKDIITKELHKVKTWVQVSNTVNDSLLRKYGEENADNYFLDNIWLYFDDVLREIPISSNYNQERYLQSNTYVQLQEGEFIYLVKFIDFKIKDSTTPLEFETENIRKYILIQRKSKWLEDKRKIMYEEAVSSSKIKLWTN